MKTTNLLHEDAVCSARDNAATVARRFAELSDLANASRVSGIDADAAAGLAFSAGARLASAISCYLVSVANEI